MGIDVNGALGHSAQFGANADNIGYLKRQLLELQSDINTYWISGEMKFINTKIDAVVRQMQEAINELNSLKGDISSVAYEIREEERLEEERRERERQEQERLERERQQNSAQQTHVKE